MCFRFQSIPFVLVFLTLFASGWSEAQTLRISEFMASNGSSLLDEDGDASDWIEIYNPSSQAVALAGWSLTDRPTDLDQWRFPAMTLDAGGFLIVFASGKNRQDPNAPLHTNFSLSSDGEYLALVAPDGQTVVQDFGDAYPKQFRDVSYGINHTGTPLLSPDREGLYALPPTDDPTSLSWTRSDFDDSLWTTTSMPLLFDSVSHHDLVGHWKLNATSSTVLAPDSLGDYDGRIWGYEPAWTTATPTIAPWIDSALLFDSVHHSVEIPNSEEAFDFDTALTISCWFRADGFDADWQALVTKGETAWRLHRDDDGTRIRLDCAGLNGPTSVRAEQKVTDWDWHHVAALYDGARLAIWLDGKLEGDVATSGTVAHNDAAVMIGENAEALGRRWHGAIADVRIYRRALEASEIQALYTNQSAPDTLRHQVMGYSPSILSRWPFHAETPDAFDALRFRIRYQDGVAAWINGVYVGALHAPEPPTWDQTATDLRPDSLRNHYEEISLAEHESLLTTGANVLALALYNDALEDPNLFAEPELWGVHHDEAARYFQAATPGWFNETNSIGYLPAVEFDIPPGFYDAPFDLTLTCVESDVTIRYTLDFSEPSESNGVTYTGPIRIDGTTILRAISLKDGYQSRGSVTRSFIFLDEVLTQSAMPDDFPTTWGPVAADYEMDPRVVNDPAYSGTIRSDLQSLPSMSITMDMDDLFDPTTGIYANSEARGVEWERPGSVEFFDPRGGEDGFQINCGLRMHGGFGSHPEYRKHSFRFLFKSEYGSTKLRYPIFGSDAADEFDSIVARAGYNDSWMRSEKSQYVRDQWMRRSYLEMDHYAPRGRYVHLYVNGLYWGLYNPVERPNADFSSTYRGGEKEEWDVLNADPSNPTDGDAEVWKQIQNIASNGAADTNGYNALAEYLNIPVLIDYFVLNFYGVNTDWDRGNWYAGRRRVPGELYECYVWDGEAVLKRLDVPNILDLNFKNEPSRLYSQLKYNTEFRALFADRAHALLSDGGVLSPERSQARYRDLAAQIERAIVCESARWGDHNRSEPYTLNDAWLPERQHIVDEVLVTRGDDLIALLKSKNLYPATDAPFLSPRNAKGTQPLTVTIENPNPGGVIYYTTDGSDPREPHFIENPEQVIVSENAFKKVFVPTLENGGDTLGTSWTARTGFDDTRWTTGTGGVGYETYTGYEPFIQIDLLEAMYGITAGCYLRIPFHVTAEQIQSVDILHLAVRLDDAFIAYLNGEKVTQSYYAPTDPTWDSVSRQLNAGDDAVIPANFDITQYKHLLNEGENMLAIHAMNVDASSPDFLISPQLLSITTPVGLLSTTATPYSAPLTLSQSAIVKARVLSEDGEWSPLADGEFLIEPEPIAPTLAISEVMYAPSGDRDNEYLELINIGTEPYQITTEAFTNGIDYALPPGLIIEPNGLLLLTRAAPDNNFAFFRTHYNLSEAIPIFGPYAGRLSNEGERITLSTALINGADILSFEYKTSRGWPVAAAGAGHSMVPVHSAPHPDGALDYPGAWRASAFMKGSPGAPNPEPIRNLLINELAANTTYSAPPYDSNDWIELFNNGNEAVDTTGFFLSDDPINLRKWALPPQLIPRSSRVLYSEISHFNNPLGSGFGLSKDGETLFLSYLDGTAMDRIVDAIRFKAQAPWTSLGRYPDGGAFWFAAVPSQSMANRAGNLDLRIDEIMYAPPPNSSVADPETLEYIEIVNPTNQIITLWNVDGPWRLDGEVDYIFPVGMQLAPGERLLVTPFAPTDALALAVFKETYHAALTGVQIVGPYVGRLSNRVGRIRLERPQATGLFPGDVAGVIVDEVEYFDRSPFPSAPDGSGASLQRREPNGAGVDPANWKASAPSPGYGAEAGGVKSARYRLVY